MDLINELRRMVHDHDQAADKALSLWSWLPSYHFAKKAHGDYASGVGQPRMDHIMREASMVFSYIAGYDIDIDNEETRQWFVCGCDQCRASLPTSTEVRAVLAEFRKGPSK